MSGFDLQRSSGASEAFTEANSADRTQEINPLDQKFVAETFVLTNVPNATPDETVIIDLDGFSRCAIHLEQSGGTDTFTWTILASVEGSDSTDDWIDVTQYGMTSASVTGASSYTADGILYLNDGFVPRALKVKVVTAGGANDSDFNLFVKKMY